MSVEFKDLPIAERRLKILEYIDQYQECHNGHSPTAREIQKALHTSGTGVVHYNIESMEGFGWITTPEKTEKGHRKAGTITITEKGREQLTAYQQQSGTPPTLLQLPLVSPGTTAVPQPPVEPPVSPTGEDKPAQKPVKRVLEVGTVILSARISDRKAARTITIPVLNLIGASYGMEHESSDYSVRGLDAESYLNISQDMLGRHKVEDLFALEVRGDSMIEAGIQSGDYVILKKTQAAENGDMCAVFIDGSEATLKYFYREEKRIRLEAANQRIPPRDIGPSHTVEIQGRVILVVRL